MKIAHYPLVKELQAIISDLESEVTEGTDKIRRLKRRWRYWSIFLAIILALLLVWGLLEALKTTP